MARPPRIDLGGIAYHVLNRGNARMRIFNKDGDYEAFERLIEQALDRVALRLCAYCLMPNHWHFVVWPQEDNQLTEFFGWLTMTHAKRWHAHHGTNGEGHVYQGRFKSFPAQHDDHFLCVARYVEANAFRAKLVKRAEDWRWSSLWRRVNGSAAERHMLGAWPLGIPRHWLSLVNQAQSKAEIEVVRASANRGRPLGSATWIQRTARALALESTLRGRGRPAGS